jgi:hypothetical protein
VKVPILLNEGVFAKLSLQKSASTLNVLIKPQKRSLFTESCFSDFSTDLSSTNPSISSIGYSGNLPVK